MTPFLSGTVTFLFTDIEGSTQLLHRLGEGYARVLAEQREILRVAFEKFNGREMDTQGDAFFVAFARASDAVNAVAESQRALASHPWIDGVTVRVRMALHTGEPIIGATGYIGMDVHRAARICSAGHGGQVLLSQTTSDLVQDHLPYDVSLRDLGEHRLKDLQRPEHIFQLVISGLPSEFPSLKSLDALPNNLPIQLTSFIGREKELREIKSRFATTRLLTLTGVGGTGKTRLALQVGADVLDDFHDGVWLIELAPISDAEFVPQAIATALNLREQPGRAVVDLLKDSLARKNSLLIPDNCEHLIEACAQISDTLLRAAPQLKILATSREALGIAGESTFPVPSLDLPQASQTSPESLSQYEAVRLFIERAVAVQPNFHVTNQNAPAVAQICFRLDGIPLALELAAARVRGMSVEQIASRLDDRFRLLTGGSRTALPRQRTLQAAIDWSYKLLSEQERVLLQRLSVFVGGWSLEAAEFICSGAGLDSSEILDLLLRLVDKSLVVAQASEINSRYHWLETIRQYAQEKLVEAGETEFIRDQHLEFFSEFVARLEPRIRSAELPIALAELEADYDNVRAAIQWALNKNVQKGMRMAAELVQFWRMRGLHSEARQTLRNLLEHPDR